MTEANDPLDSGTSRLLLLSEDISPEATRTFVHDLHPSQAGLDEERQETDFEREE